MENRQALGYMILAMERNGYTREEIKKVYGDMYYFFDIITEEEADQRGHDHLYEKDM